MLSPGRLGAALVGLALATTLTAPGSAAADPLFQTSVAYDGPTMIAQGQPAALSAALADSGATGVGGRMVRLTLGTGPGSQSCDGITDLFGRATCAVSRVSVGLGSQPLTAAFAGDALYSPSSDASRPATVFANPADGMFVLGDLTVRNAGGATVLYWGPDWAKQNDLSGGDAPSAFKGFADFVDTSGPCAGPWSTRPGNSSKPPQTVPAVIAVLVASRITKSGSTISGDTRRIVLVQTDSGYGPAPGHRGTGRVVGTVCIGGVL